MGYEQGRENGAVVESSRAGASELFAGRWCGVGGNKRNEERGAFGRRRSCSRQQTEQKHPVEEVSQDLASSDVRDRGREGGREGEAGD